MNFLIHMLLSGDDEQLLVCNFMGDFVKGNLAVYSVLKTPLHQFCIRFIAGKRGGDLNTWKEKRG